MPSEKMWSGKPASVSQMGGIMQARSNTGFAILQSAIMRRRFFVDQIRNGQAEIAGDDARHLTRVLRVEVGQRYEISDNRSVYLAEIQTARKEHVIFKKLEKLPVIEPPVRMILCAAIV